MITLNGIELTLERYPSGELNLMHMFYEKLISPSLEPVVIGWAYEGGKDELEMLQYITMDIHDKWPSIPVYLNLLYIPNARMDRIHHDNEVHTLKHFGKIINNLEFEYVFALDPHSNVSEAVIDHLKIIDLSEVVQRAYKEVEAVSPMLDTDLIYFPDAGAMKRYKDLPCFSGAHLCYGEKLRDWDTGDILGIEIKNPGNYDFKDANILMIDDIISYGGTLAYSADELKKLGASRIFAYASHTENSVLNPDKGTLLKRIENGTVDLVVTTNSIYTGTHEKIKVLGV